MLMSDGSTGQGESVPVQYVTGESADDTIETVTRVGRQLVGLSVDGYRAVLDRIAKLAPESPSARCGLEMAVLDAWSQSLAAPIHMLLGGARRSVETDITIPIVPNATELTRLAWELGIHVFKVKVGSSVIEEDFDRVMEIVKAAPDARLRIDANQAFTPEAALDFVNRLVDAGASIELIEQPVKKEDIDGMHWIAERSPIPVFADESCRTPADALRLVTTTAVQGLNLKINKCGIAGLLDIIPIAQAAGRRLMIGCMIEIRRSIAVSLGIACGTGAFEFLDLDSHLLLNESGDNPYFQQHGAMMTFAEPA